MNPFLDQECDDLLTKITLLVLLELYTICFDHIYPLPYPPNLLSSFFPPHHLSSPMYATHKFLDVWPSTGA